MALTTPQDAPVSLRTKLVLSYLAVIVSAILALSLAVSWTVQSYLTNAQIENLQYNLVNFWAPSYEYFYTLAHGDWNNVQERPNDPMVLVIYDKQGNNVICAETRFTQNSCTNPTIKAVL